MSARKDLVALKVERALLQQQVQLMEGQQTRLAAILEKKRLRRERNAMSGHGRQPQQGLRTKQVERLPPLSPPPPLPEVPVRKKNIVTQKPKVLVSNTAVQRLRQEHLLRTRGREALERYSTQTPGPMRKANKNRRRQKCLPSSKAPPSHFPDRYARNELPCSIEHGASGAKLNYLTTHIVQLLLQFITDLENVQAFS